ncbi:MAG: FtsK/SpoIIIE domain-containing protein [bacterium]|nr:FtsK/SpoIIIE domain-containing protein [bacterium]
MRLLFEGPEGNQEVLVSGPPIATVRELAESLGLHEPCSGLWVGDQWFSADSCLDETEIVDGARVGVLPSRELDQPGWVLEVIGGLCSGERFPMAPEGLSVGRSPEADVTLSGIGLRPQHVRVERQDQQVFVLRGEDPPITEEVSKPFRLGNALVQVSESPDDRPNRLAVVLGRTASGRIAFNRPPRTPLPQQPDPLAAPSSEPTKSPRRAVFGWAALASPLLVGLLMAVLYSPYMALFALLSPLMMGASWVDGRRRDRSEHRRSQRRAQASLVDFRTAAQAAHAAEIIRLRELHPHLAEAVRRVCLPSVRLWERRPADEDFMSLVIAHGPRAFDPELAVDGPHIADGTAAALNELGPLADVPIAVDLGPGRLLGLVGPRSATTAVARGLLLQATAWHGPADLAVLVAADEVTLPVWSWTAWLPHTAHPAIGSARLIANSRSAAAEMASELAEAWNHQGHAHWPQLLVVADGENLATGRGAPMRPLFQKSAGPVSAIVLASSVDQLPAAAAVVTVARDSSGVVDVTQAAHVHSSVLASGMSLKLARDTARRLARFEDPEQAGADSAIPDNTALLDLLELVGSKKDPASTTLADAVVDRWRINNHADGLAAPIGADGHGPVLADLAADGPHALIGGTTGSGKSELLRTMVASLAVTYSPEQINFVLVDYKGGSAFDQCASLPHVVGLVTDLDDRLAERALRCLEAEIRHREQVLRDRGATDLAHYRSRAKTGTDQPWPPLPRLVVIIDEFAALAAELPGFMDSLVNVAQRGRSLGMHLVLATQRPAGAVSANIRTNTALRIALRVLDAADSIDVLDSPEAAAIGRHQPGRALARFGPGELVEFQCALVTGVTAAKRGPRVVPAPDGIPSPQPEPASDNEIPSDLARLAAAVNSAWDSWEGVPPRRPWPDPLPSMVSLAELTPDASDMSAGVVFALADDPNRQRQCPLMWDPGQGNVLFAGNPGSGTTTALGSLAVALASRYPPGECHLYAIDSGSGQLAPLEALPHCGAVVGPDERERIRRLIRRLEDELDRRLGRGRSEPSGKQPSPPRVLALIDNWGGLAKSLDTVTDHALLASLERVWAEGPTVGVFLAAAVDQLSKVSRAIQAATPQTFVFRLGDPTLYRQWGVSVDEPTTLPPGRGFAVPSGMEIQVAIPDGGLAAAVAVIAANHPQAGGPPPVESLPVSVDAARLDQARLSSSPVYLPLGLSDDTLAPVGLTLYPGEHALILGPPRSGRSSALVLLAAAAATAGGRVAALAQPGSPLADCPDIHVSARDLDDLLSAAIAADPPTLVLIDDAETVDDANGHLKALSSDGRPGLHIVAAGRADRLRTAYGHWTSEIRFSRTGVLLQPTPLDGDLFTIQLPTRPTLPSLPGRGYLIQNGQPSIIQIADVFAGVER